MARSTANVSAMTEKRRSGSNTVTFSTREATISKYGIDCGPDLLWKNW